MTARDLLVVREVLPKPEVLNLIVHERYITLKCLDFPEQCYSRERNSLNSGKIKLGAALQIFNLFI